MRGAPIAVALAVMAAAGPAGADLRPEIVLDAGGTAAVEGDPRSGGPSLALSLLWPVEERFRAGIVLLADDLGTRRGRLTSPGGEDLGPVEALHRDAAGAAWRLEAHAPEAWGFAPFAVATWGLYRLVDDVRGAEVATDTAAGFGLGLGATRAVAARHAAGVVLRYQQLSRARAERWLSAAVEWRWQWRTGD